MFQTLIGLAADLVDFKSSTAAAVIFVLALLWLLRSWHRRRQKQGKPGVEAWQILFASVVGLWLCMTAAIAVAGWMIWKGQSLGSALSSQSKDDGPIQWYYHLTMEGGPPYKRNVFSLKFSGANVSQREVALKSASIISAVNGTKLSLEVIAQGEVVPIDQIELIPPGAPIELIAKFGPPDPNAPGKILGLDPKVFLDTWRQFSLNAADDSKTYRLTFNEGNLAAFFPGMVGPHVKKKAADK